MKFSLVIPTQDRPALLQTALQHATAPRGVDVEVVVSDNSTSEAFKKLNAEVVSSHGFPIRLVSPPRTMAVSEHFEFALQFVTGDYVAYLTDKMALLPDTLRRVQVIAQRSKPDIVNWLYAPYEVQDSKNPSGAGTLTVFPQYANTEAEFFDPLAALRFKSSGVVRREFQSMRDYVQGKIVFGCFRSDLLKKIHDKSGTVFSGATHDYSAMIQGLALARSCVMLGGLGIAFIALPRDESMGSLTATEPQRALQYFRLLSNGDSILSSLPVPGVYASQHNMVAYDYRKFLPQYGYAHYYNEVNWLSAIRADLLDANKIWTSAAEKAQQLELFEEYLRVTGKRTALRVKAMRERVGVAINSVIDRISPRRDARDTPKPETRASATLNDAINYLVAE
jgi:hypothetical protein